MIANEWKEYQILDAAYGEKLERWGDYILKRPDPQVLWPAPKKMHESWTQADADYIRSNKGGGHWKIRTHLPERWQITYKKLRFEIRPTGFKHTGLFPEQAANWDYMMKKVESSQGPMQVLNLFAYTGGATCAASKAGAKEVCHVDASKGMVQWAKKNAKLNELENNRIRYFVDDVPKFVAKEIRRGRTYQGIILDPPAYGRGPNKELWKIEDTLVDLLVDIEKLLADDASFVILNCYASSLTPWAIDNMLRAIFQQKRGGDIKTSEIGLPIENSEMILPCGITGKWEKS